jgi:hypothetical protein
MEKIRSLGTRFARLRQDDFFVKQARQHFHLLLKTSPYTLFIAYLYNHIELPCTVANIPGSFPTLRPPLSCTTVAHHDLQSALAELKQEHPSTIIELSLTNSTLTLTTGQIEAALSRSLAATASQLAGPETRLRIDAAALQQIVESAPAHTEAWRICVDRYADAVQFNAEPAPVGDAGMVWRHEVRGR